MAQLTPVGTPQIPIFPPDYEKGLFDRFANILQLYFNQINNSINSLLNISGGQYLGFPSGSFYSNVTQTASVINTAYPITFNNTFFGNGITIDSIISSKLDFTVSGYYLVEFSVNLSRSITNATNAYFWLSLNGTAVTNSTFITQQNTYTPLTYNCSGSFLLPIIAGNYLQLMWSTDLITTSITPITLSSPHTAAPSVTVNISFVSNIST
jgi:hypothetical protein